MGTWTSQPLIKGYGQKDEIDGFKKLKKKLTTTTFDSDIISTSDMSKKIMQDKSRTEHDSESDKSDSENFSGISKISNSLSENNAFQSPKTPETRLPISPTFGALVNLQRRSRQLESIDNRKILL